MSRSPRESILRDDDHRLRLPIRLVWNDAERRLRAPIRLVVGSALIFVFLAIGNQYTPTLLTGDGPLPDAINRMVGQLPFAISTCIGVALAAILLDRRTVTDLGLDLDRDWWRGLGGGIALGAGITVSSVVVGLVFGYYEFDGVQIAGGVGVWLVTAVAGTAFQLFWVIPEELFVRGYVITNITEGLDGGPMIPRSLAAGVGVIVSAFIFYLTHASGRGFVFGVMAGGLAILLGVGYVLSGSLSLPIGIHFGMNFAGVLVGTNFLPESLLRVSAASSVEGSLALPLEAVVVRLLGGTLGVALLFWWYYAVSNQVRIAPTVARPRLRWRHDGDATDE